MPKDDFGWSETEVQKVLSLGRLGESFGIIAQKVRHGAVQVARCWRLYASTEDVETRLDAKDAHFVDRAVPRETASLPADLRFPDDPRAVAECGVPRIAAPRFNRSVIGSSAL